MAAARARADGGGSGRQLALDPSAGAALAAELTDRDEDDPAQRAGGARQPGPDRGARRGRARACCARERVSGIVLARSSERLPAACTTVIELADEAGRGRCCTGRPAGERIDPLLVAGMSRRTARECALGAGPLRGRRPPADRRLAARLRQPVRLARPGRAALDDELRDAWRASAGKSPSWRPTFALSEDGPAVDRPRRRRSARPHRRHHRRGQERAAAQPRRRAGGRALAHRGSTSS